MYNSFQRQHDRFMNCLRIYKPAYYKIITLSYDEEAIEMKKCLRNLETYNVKLIDRNTCEIVEIPSMTRFGYFILNGKSYVWPFKETYIPNFIYKTSIDAVEVWSAKIETPWKMYQSRFRIFIKKGCLFVEQAYKAGAQKLSDFILENAIYDLEIFIEDEKEKMKYKMLLSGRKDNMKSKSLNINEDNFLPHLDSLKTKSVFMSLMIRHILNDIIPVVNSNDVHFKRLVGVDWLVGDICDRLNANFNAKVSNYMLRRIQYNGQLLKNKSFFESISHVSRVIRGSNSYGNHKKRELDDSHINIYCPYRIAEGEDVGLKVDIVDALEVTQSCIPTIPESMDIYNGYLRDDTKTHVFESKNWIFLDGCQIVKNTTTNNLKIGSVAKHIIFQRHLPPVRVSYATTHLKQASKLAYPQIPVISPKNDVTTINGTNAIVAVMSFDGWNIEDAIVANRDFVVRGGLTSIKTEKIIWRRNANENFHEKKLHKYNTIANHNICIGKKTKNGMDTSIRGYRGRVIDSYDLKHTRVVDLEYLHKPEIGDKLSNRSGQKGVIGFLCNSHDMPYSFDGIIPDIIINPACMPSRMTVSQMLESYFGSEALINGKLGHDSNVDIQNTHFNKETGKQELICGKTGNRLMRPIFLGNVFYMALNHIVSKKWKSRSFGAYNILTGQAIKGGSNGGLRIGEMERDQIRSRITSNISERVLSDRLLKSCDATLVSICKSCGTLEPNTCCQSPKVIRVQMSKSSRLMLMEIYSFGIFPRIHL